MRVRRSYRSTELRRQSDLRSTKTGARSGFQAAQVILRLPRIARDDAALESSRLEDSWPEHSRKPAAISVLRHRLCFRRQSRDWCWLVGTPRAGLLRSAERLARAHQT